VTDLKPIEIRRVWVLTTIIRRFPEERAALAWSQNHSPIAQPEKGERCCKGAASEAVAATMIEYFIASFSSSLNKLRNSRTLLANSDIDTIELLLILTLVPAPLVEDGVNGNSSFACLTVTSDTHAGHD
jgi:hypothetical protein